MSRAKSLPLDFLAPLRDISTTSWLAIAPILLGLAAMYGPTFVAMAGAEWDSETHAHGPMVLMVALWLFWSTATRIVTEDGGIESEPAPFAGVIALFFGIGLYVVGRSQSVVWFDAGSLIPIAVGILLLLGGWPLARRFWFPLVFLVFLVPPPAMVLDAITTPLRQWVSVVAEFLLYHAGYPIARNGVVLSIDRYHLFVADACSGLNSINALLATGLFYLYLVRHTNRLRQGLLLASIIPIALAANLVRVIALVLITYYAGDETAQGFVHTFGGMVLFLAALAMLFTFDGLLGLLPGLRNRKD